MLKYTWKCETNNTNTINTKLLESSFNPLFFINFIKIKTIIKKK